MQILICLETQKDWIDVAMEHRREEWDGGDVMRTQTQGYLSATFNVITDIAFCLHQHFSTFKFREARQKRNFDETLKLKHGWFLE